ncbi:hypothetical protein [Cryobacterium sp. Hh38]|uniref:hypothetical protein n=1 Tax=Cryobacterium sp. Hh38 TaxID=1259156 RepID=UPI00106B1A73|nr:hypothetical protein [Cryobacterium sp. Hh38]TFD56688.1 hypothetical protein E3T41_16075 [Cryobacterium sp. Hh38]
MLHISPDGPALTVKQAKILDDEFFQARPLAYFSARIAALLNALSDQSTVTNVNATGFLEALGDAELASILDHGESDRDLQVALDSVSVRHHAAEALVRMLHAVVVSKTRPGDAVCVWAAIADGPNSLHTVAQELAEALNGDTSAFARAFFPASKAHSSEEVQAFGIAWAWVLRSIQLLTDNNLTVNAAHNKVKHGLAVRTRDDVRIELLRGDGPIEDGTIPLSSFGPDKSIVIFDRPMITYLARPYPPHKQGLELVSLRIDPPAVLAEGWMISWVYASLFHVAAANHGSTPEGGLAPYPAPRTGPTPAQLLENSGAAALGYRGSVTTSPDQSFEPRPSGVFFPGFFQEMTIDFENVTTATVVD